MKKILSLPPLSHIVTMFREDTWDSLRNEFDVYENDSPGQMTPAQVRGLIGERDAIMTGWGSTPFTREMLDSAENLKIIAHTAGTVKFLFTRDLVEEVLIPRGITVFSGNDGLAINAAEATVGLMIAASRRWPEHIDAFGRMGQREIPRNGQFLSGATVGIVAASKVARHVLRLLQPFNCEILLYDPFVTPEAARGLGVELVKLDDLFKRSDIVSVHAPELPATQKMVGASQLKKLQDGALLVNTSHGSVIDHEALLKEVRGGRITAALDVTDPEPLPSDSEFWTLPNVVLTPHLARDGYAGYFRIGDNTLQALRDCFNGRPVAGAVPLENWDILN